MKTEILAMLACGLMFTNTGSAQEQNDESLVIFEENFSKCNGTGGNDGSFTYNSDNEDFSDSHADNTGWTVKNVKAASNCVTLRTYNYWLVKQTESYIETPAIDYSGKVVISMKLGGQIGLLGDLFDTSATLDVSINGTSIGKKTFQHSQFDYYTFETYINAGDKVRMSLDALVSERVVCVDEVKILKESITIDEALDNSATITGHAGQKTNVELKRTLATDHWNTFCVPFDVTQQQADFIFGNNTKIRKFERLGGKDGHDMQFVEVHEIKAGTPVLIWPTTTTVNPMFTDVTIPAGIDPSHCETAIDSYKFVGKYSPYTMATDGTEQFLGTGNFLYVPESTAKATIKGLRAFFYIPDSDTGSKVSIEGDETTGIDATEVGIQPADDKVYDLNGRLAGHTLEGLGKGIYIKGGKKVVVR
ncbi:MAG: hypothetical protein ACI350_08475 [Prevotella sp.]